MLYDDRTLANRVRLRVKLPRCMLVALVRVRDELRSGALPYHRYRSFVSKGEPTTGKYFNMLYWSSPCGTVHCIGGWVRAYVGKQVYDNFMNDLNDQWTSRSRSARALFELFCPAGFPFKFNEVTVNEAADAIDRLLYEGQAWR